MESVDVSKINECPVCISTMKVPITLTCSHTFCYLCIKETMMNNIYTCPLCRRNIPVGTLEHATTNIDARDEHTENYAWMYSGRKGGWWYYEPTHNTQIEEAYVKYLQEPDDPGHCAEEGNDPCETSDSDRAGNWETKMEICGKSYYINFVGMQQIPVEYGIVRDIKRVEVNGSLDLSKAKGIAGLRYTKDM